MTAKLSTTALAKLTSTDAKSLFQKLSFYGYVTRHNDKWLLTNIGEKFGGEYVSHKEYGAFIVWPKNLVIDTSISAGIHMTATQIGEKLSLSAKKVNQILNELGWIVRKEDGWHLTEAGIKAGGVQKEGKGTSKYFIVWHDTILRDINFRRSVSEFTGADSELNSTDKSFSSFQQKFAAKHRTSDGHYVRSKGELLIDNWLYMAGLVHAYERKLPIEEEVFSNFYLPSGRVYIQFWGSDSGSTSEQSRQERRKLYQKHNFQLIEIEVEDLDNLDEKLPAELRRFGVTAY